MKLSILVLLLAAVSAQAQVVGIERDVLGSGTPGKPGYEQAFPVLENDIFHAPQYLPHHPTAATIWPRVVEVSCTKISEGLKCAGYRWLPKLGRAEYLFFTPKIEETPVQPTAPRVIVIQGPERVTERIILKEVPVKGKGE